MILYGIPNCDTVKKARSWLADRNIAYSFHDYKKAGIDAATLDGWIDQLGWAVLLNKAGTTFRRLDDADKADIDRAKAARLMLSNPSMIKRPVLVDARGILVGFQQDQWEAHFG